MNNLNAIQRVMALAGDASPFLINMIMGSARHPGIVFGPNVRVSGDFKYLPFRLEYSRGAVGEFAISFLRAFLSPGSSNRARAELISQNEALLQRVPISLSGGGLEVTEALQRGMIPSNKLTRQLGDYTGGYLGFRRMMTAFQHAYESSIDYAGIHLLKALEGSKRYDITTPQDLVDLKDYIDNIRGIASSRRLGVKSNQRAMEASILLAPRYRRAIAAIHVNVMQNNLRGKMARDAYLALGAAIPFIYTAISIAKSVEEAQREDKWGDMRHWENLGNELVNGLNPTHPGFVMWQAGNQAYGVGSKFVSDWRAFAKAITYPARKMGAELSIPEGVPLVGGQQLLRPTAKDWLDEDDLSRNAFVRWIRGQVAMVPSIGADWGFGKDYLGEPLPRTPMGDPKEFAKAWGKNLSGYAMFLWAHSAAFDGGTWRDRLNRGMGEFGGLRAHPSSFYAVADGVAQDLYNEEYEYLESYQRDAVRLDPIIKELVPRTGSISEELDKIDKELIEKLTAIANDPDLKNPFPNYSAAENEARGRRKQVFGEEFENSNNLESDDPNERAIAEYWSPLDTPEYEDAPPSKKKAVAERLRAKYKWTKSQREAIHRSLYRRPVPGGLIHKMGEEGMRRKASQDARIRHMKEQGVPSHVIEAYNNWYWVGDMPGGIGGVPTNPEAFYMYQLYGPGRRR